MHLERLSIYHSCGGKYRGSIAVSGRNGQVDLVLTPEQIKSLVAIVAESLVDAAREVAEKLTEECINIQPTKIEGKAKEEGVA